jgi:hypothetical protein
MCVDRSGCQAFLSCQAARRSHSKAMLVHIGLLCWMVLLVMV